MPEPPSSADHSCGVKLLMCSMHVLPLHFVRELNGRDCATGQTGANSSSFWEDTSATAVEASSVSEEHADGR